MSSEEKDKENKDEETEEEKKTPKEVINKIFSETNVTVILWFITIYLLLMRTLGLFRQDDMSVQVKLLDFVFLLVLLSVIFNDFYGLSKENRQEPLYSAFSRLKVFLNDYNSIFVVFLMNVGLYIIVRLFQLDVNNLPSTINFIYLLLIFTLVFLVVIFIVQELLGVPVIDDIYKAFGKYLDEMEEDEDEEEEELEQQKKISGEEVYNISNNLYTYEEAPHVCQAFNGRLATYDEIEEAYNNGAEWCNYGWSQDQMAYFPTQKDTWSKMQIHKESKNACGRPGINGGYMANPNLKFGVNCYGIKPDPSAHEENIMIANRDRVFPRGKAQTAIDKKVQFWKENADKLLTINGYNKDNWSRY